MTVNKNSCVHPYRHEPEKDMEEEEIWQKQQFWEIDLFI